MRFIGLCLLGCAGLMAGCAGDQETIKPEAFLQQYQLSRPQISAVTYCSSHDCLERTEISLTEAEWKRISGWVEALAKDAGEEREKLAQAVAEYEKIAAAKAGTSGDKARTGMNSDRQLDCIDESLNTTSILLLLQEKGFIGYHSLNGTEGRGEAFDWPHFATSLRETKSGDIYVIDSWFRDNGEKADILSLADWKRGWNPPGFK